MIKLNNIDIFRLKLRIAIFGLFLTALSIPGSESLAVSNAGNMYQVITKSFLIILPLIIFPHSIYLKNEQIRKNILLILIGIYGIITVLWSPMPAYTFIRSTSFVITILGITTIFCAYIKEIKSPYSALLFDLFLTTGIILWFFTVIGVLNFEIAWRKVYLPNGIIKRLGGDILPPNTLGALAAMHIIFTLKNGFNKKIFNYASILSGCYVLMYSNSRNALAALIIASIIIFFISSFVFLHLKRIIFIFFGFAILSGSLFFLEPQNFNKWLVSISRYEAIEEFMTLTGRTLIWEKIFSQPLLDMLVGQGYAVLSENGMIIVESIRTTNAHNGFLQVFAGTGLIGFLLFLFYLFQLMIHLIITQKNNSGENKNQFRFWIIFLLLIFILINNLAESSFGSQIVPQLIIFLFLSLMVTNKFENSKDPVLYPSVTV